MGSRVALYAWGCISSRSSLLEPRCSLNPAPADPGLNPCLRRRLTCLRRDGAGVPTCSRFELQALGRSRQWRLAGHVARTHHLAMREPSAEDGTWPRSPSSRARTPTYRRVGTSTAQTQPTQCAELDIYIAMQARGRLRFIDDPAWLLRLHLAAMTDPKDQEGPKGSRGEPWSIDDAEPANSSDREASSPVDRASRSRSIDPGGASAFS